MEIYHLRPNTTYEFRIWGNNQLGAGDIATTVVQTLAEFSDEGFVDFLFLRNEFIYFLLV